MLCITRDDRIHAKEACKNNKVCTISLPLHTVTLISISSNYFVGDLALCSTREKIDDFSVNFLDANF